MKHEAIVSEFGDLLTDWIVPGSFELETFARKAIQEMRTDAMRRMDPDPYLVLVFDREHAMRFHIPPENASLMNDGQAKTLLFAFLRTMNTVVEAYVFGTEVWSSRPTKEGSQHDMEEHQQFMDSGFKTLVEMGWVVVEEALIVVAQTETDVVQAVQTFIRKPDTREIQLCGSPEITRLRQDQFGGRMKMWGATEADAIGHVSE